MRKKMNPSEISTNAKNQLKTIINELFHDGMEIKFNNLVDILSNIQSKTDQISRINRLLDESSKKVNATIDDSFKDIKNNQLYELKANTENVIESQTQLHLSLNDLKTSKIAELNSSIVQLYNFITKTIDDSFKDIKNNQLFELKTHTKSIIEAQTQLHSSLDDLRTDEFSELNSGINQLKESIDKNFESIECVTIKLEDLSTNCAEVGILVSDIHKNNEKIDLIGKTQAECINVINEIMNQEFNSLKSWIELLLVRRVEEECKNNINILIGNKLDELIFNEENARNRLREFHDEFNTQMNQLKEEEKHSNMNIAKLENDLSLLRSENATNKKILFFIGGLASVSLITIFILLYILIIS